MDPVIILLATSDHVREIMVIECMSFPSPWDKETFLITLEDERCNSFVAIEDGMIVGYCLALNLADMVHILNLAVHRNYRRRGIARQLVNEILMDAEVKDKVYAVLEVRKSNVSARSLYLSMGFSHISTWSRYYTDTNEDAAIMVKDLRSGMVQDIECTVIRNVEVATQTFHIILEGELPLSGPGQFSMVQINNSVEPFLRRPLAILGQKNKRQELLYRIRGEGTRSLSEKKEGETLKVLGPLGRGFTRHDGKKIIYVAGGTGLPPVLSLAERIKSGHFIIGAKNRNDLPLLERIQAIPNTEIIIMTEDGSFGKKGLATDVIGDVIRDGDYDEDTIIYACGPEGMLKKVSTLAVKTGILCEISLEERMSCGFGACAGCIVRTINGNKRVCREGPVFSARDIIWG
jgi:dihydroorotate dehydrogenase electron transfer subunit